MIFKHLVLVAMLSTAGVSAQSSIFIPDKDASKDTCNSIPFGIYEHPKYPYPREFKYQTLVTAAQFGSFVPKVIRQLGFASCRTGVQSFSKITIWMDLTVATKLDKTFAKNLSAKAVKILDADNYYWHTKKDSWNSIGLEKAFPFSAGKSLVIDIEVKAAKFLTPSFAQSLKIIGGFHTSDRKVPRLYALGWGTKPPATGRLGSAGLRIMLSSELASYATYGIGCVGNGKVRLALGYDSQSLPKIGGQAKVQLANGIPGYPAILAIDFGSALRLPFQPIPLTAFPGCNLYVFLHLTLITVTDSKGGVTVPLGIPNSSSLLNLAFYTQYFQPEFAPIALRASNYGRVLIGR